MRRFRSTTIAVLLALLASVSPVLAQPSGVVGPGGVWDSVVVPVAVQNTTTATTLYSVVVPAGLDGLRGPRLHCNIIGRIITATNTTAATLTAAYGGQTLTLISNATVTADTAVQKAFEFEIKLATASASGLIADIHGVAIIGSGTAAASQVFTAITNGTRTVATVANRTLTITWTWPVAGGLTAITADNVICKVG